MSYSGCSVKNFRSWSTSFRMSARVTVFLIPGLGGAFAEGITVRSSCLNASKAGECVVCGKADGDSDLRHSLLRAGAVLAAQMDWA